MHFGGSRSVGAPCPRPPFLVSHGRSRGEQPHTKKKMMIKKHELRMQYVRG